MLWRTVTTRQQPWRGNTSLSTPVRRERALRGLGDGGTLRFVLVYQLRMHGRRCLIKFNNKMHCPLDQDPAASRGCNARRARTTHSRGTSHCVRAVEVSHSSTFPRAASGPSEARLERWCRCAHRILGGFCERARAPLVHRPLRLLWYRLPSAVFTMYVFHYWHWAVVVRRTRAGADLARGCGLCGGWATVGGQQRAPVMVDAGLSRATSLAGAVVSAYPVCRRCGCAACTSLLRLHRLAARFTLLI